MGQDNQQQDTQAGECPIWLLQELKPMDDLLKVGRKNLLLANDLL